MLLLFLIVKFPLPLLDNNICCGEQGMRPETRLKHFLEPKGKCCFRKGFVLNGIRYKKGFCYRKGFVMQDFVMKKMKKEKSSALVCSKKERKKRIQPNAIFYFFQPKL